METRAAKLVCFSPTGTTKAIAQAMARGLYMHAPEIIDITLPKAREGQFHTTDQELLVVAVPVYVGRVPALLLDWLNGLQARQTPVVCVVVYGNRGYGDALTELKEILTSRGCVPVACGAFIGEHSFSSEETPIAVDRPDGGDLNRASQFGWKVSEKLRSMVSVGQISGIQVPGTPPFGPADPLLSEEFMAVSDACTRCGICMKDCPVGAINPANMMRPDPKACILCCACIKRCPVNARSMVPGSVKGIAQQLSDTCQVRKAPELFF